MLRYRALWLGIGWGLVFLVSYLTLSPAPPDFYLEFEYADKIKHFIAYFCLMFWFAQLYKKIKIRIAYVIFFISMGVFLEVLQGFGGVRFFEYYDMLANAVGVAIAWLLTNGRLNNILFSFEKNIIQRVQQ